MENSASRLHLLLQEALAKGHPQEPVHIVWKRALGVDAKSELEFLERYADLLRTSQEAEADIRALTRINHDLFLSWVGPLKNLLNPQHHYGQWSNVRTLYPETASLALQFAADELHRHPENEAIPVAEIEALQTSVEALQKEIIEAEIDSDIRNLLVQQCECIRTALLAYRLRGADAIKSALERAIGAACLSKELFSKPSSKPFKERFFKIIAMMAKCVETAHKLQQLTSTASSVLGQVL